MTPSKPDRLPCKAPPPDTLTWRVWAPTQGLGGRHKLPVPDKQGGAGLPQPWSLIVRMASLDELLLLLLPHHHVLRPSAAALNGGLTSTAPPASAQQPEEALPCRSPAG